MSNSDCSCWHQHSWEMYPHPFHDLSCPVKRTEKDSLSLCWFLWHLHTTLSTSVGITLRLYQALNLGQALLFPFFFFFAVALPNHHHHPVAPSALLSLPHWDLLTLDKKNPKHVPCSTAAKTACWLSDRGTQSVKGEKKHAPFLSSFSPFHLPSLCTTEQMLMFPFF